MKRLVHRLLPVMACLYIFIIGWPGVPQIMAQDIENDEGVIADVFEPGLGQPVGSVQLVQGDVLIFHENNLEKSYTAEAGLLLYKGDLIVTKSDAKVSLKLNDASIITLADDTRLTINQSLFDPDNTKTRQSFISMTLGKVRFWVKKMTNFQRSDFKVKTKTAVVGVRGSDFIIKATLKSTEVTALEKTSIEVISLVAAEAELDRPFVLTDFEQTVIRAGALPSRIQEVFPEDIEMMKKEFMIKSDKELVVKVKKEEPDVFKPINPEGVMVSKRFIVEPVLTGQVIEPVKDGDPFLSKMKKDTTLIKNDVIQVGDELHENVLEDMIKELPGFPGEPDR